MAATARVLVEERNDSNIIEFPVKTRDNKKKNKKSEVYPYEIDDLKNMLNYFDANNQKIHYLALTLGVNMARRVGDMLNLTWEHFFNPETGDFRKDIMEIVEDKTDKLANPHINSAVKAAIRKYIAETGCDVTANGYKNKVFMQLTGTHRGNVMTADGHRKALKKAAVACGIDYNVGTHSARKTFGKISRMIHPNDYDSMELLQTIYNHSDTKTTKHYIGLTKEKVDQYFDDFGEMFDSYVTGDRVFENPTKKAVVSIEMADLRDLVKMVFNTAMDIDKADAMAAVESMNNIYSVLDTLVK